MCLWGGDIPRRVDVSRSDPLIRARLYIEHPRYAALANERQRDSAVVLIWRESAAIDRDSAECAGDKLLEIERLSHH